MDPENVYYVYYLMESIRRMCYLNSYRWNDKFILNRHYKFDEESGERKK